jgi:predicted nucleic acid-binding protein
MAERWVVNASPLIVLAKVGHAHLLSALADEIVAPQKVIDEINAGPADDPARAWLSNYPLQVAAISRAPAELLAWDLGAGETAVMAYALANSGWKAILDDHAARKCASSFGIQVKGTLAVVIMAKQRGLILSAAEMMRQLQQHGYRIQESMIRDALARTVGEVW